MIFLLDNNFESLNFANYALLFFDVSLSAASNLKQSVVTSRRVDAAISVWADQIGT